MNINELTFSIAKEDDIDGIMMIENNFFDSEIAYSKEDIIKWMTLNKEMFYVVRNVDNQVVAFTIIVPITAHCFNKFKNGEVKDLGDFELRDIIPYMESAYYYFVDVTCLNKDRNASMVMFRNILPLLIEKAKYIVTPPVTEEGKIKAGKLCAKNASGESSLELGNPCYIDVKEATPSANRMIDITVKFLERAKKR